MSVTLKVNGQEYGGWTRVRIVRGIEQLAGEFELELTDRWNTANGLQSYSIAEGMPCEVLIDNEVVITGYIDTFEPSFDEQSHSIICTGRDKAGDLVDCSAIYKSGQWRNATVGKIASDLLAPFGIGLIVAATVGAPLPVFAIQEGSSVYEEIERAAKMRALLTVSDGRGNVVLTRAGTQRGAADLVEGQNMKRGRAVFDGKDRFSQYVVKGQSPGDDHDFGESVAHQSATVTDAGVKRYRPLVVLAEDHDKTATLRQRAEWERNVRFGRSKRATVLAYDWRANGELWKPNTVVRVVSPMLTADLELLIVRVEHSLDDMGTLTNIELAHAAAFDTIENVKQTRLEKKIYKAQGTESSIDDSAWKDDRR